MVIARSPYLALSRIEHVARTGRGDGQPRTCHVYLRDGVSCASRRVYSAVTDRT